jgi:EF-P beta-lysylation protein EpmB
MNTPVWVQKWSQNITNLDSLLDMVQIKKEDRAMLGLGEKVLLNVPIRIVSKMRKGSIDDPLFLQFIPHSGVEKPREGSVDPLEERKAVCTGSLLKKYEGRALILVTKTCAMQCQFCFRKHYDFKIQKYQFADELFWISNDKSLEEIILSGGDPLSIHTQELGSLLTRISAIDHVKRIRIHTRFPIGIPERIDDEFTEMLNTIKKQILFVLHINHAKEIDEEVARAIERLRKTGIILLSQTVFLKGINDSVEALSDLFKMLVRNGVVPYYIHQLDKVSGVLHYEVLPERAMMIMRTLHETLPGYMVPRYVQEIGGKKGKKIFPTYPV